jgi:ankyrin repeat protein
MVSPSPQSRSGSTSRKHKSVRHDHTKAKRQKKQSNQIMYRNVAMKGKSRGHFGHQYTCNEYHAPVLQSSDRCFPESQPRATGVQSDPVLESLKFDQMEDHYLTLKSAHADTCQWLFESAEYLDWLDPKQRSSNNGILWIKGKPGAGKSTLMKCAVQRAQELPDSPISISFFFHARGGTLEKTTEGMYRSLLTQIVENIPRLRALLDKQSWRDSWTVEILSHFFRKAILALDQDHLTCYIDALDECDDDEIRAMVEVFENLTELATARKIQFRACFSSRHYPHITMTKCQELKLEDQEGHQDDITAYIKSNFRAPLPERSKSHIAEHIQLLASGIFLWVVLVLPILNVDADRGHAHKLKARLKEIPIDLDKLFQSIILRGTQEDTYLVPTLQWIMFARRPLRCEELYQAIMQVPAVQNGDYEEDEDVYLVNGMTSENMENFLLDSSKGLAEMTKGKQPTVQFIHESVRNYLRDTGLQMITSDLCENLDGASHDYLRRCCLHFVCEDVLQQLAVPKLLPDVKSEFVALRDRASIIFPFLDYAIQNLVFHADEASDSFIVPEEAVEAFPLSSWRTLNNLFEKYGTRRYTPDVTKLYIFAEKGAARLFGFELRKGTDLVTVSAERHGTPLGAAVFERNANIVTSILEHNRAAEYCPEEQRKYLEIALKQRTPQIAESLLRLTTKVDVDGTDYAKALQIACLEGYSPLVAMLLSRGADPDTQDPQDNALQAACSRGHTSIVQILLDNGVSVNLQARLDGSRHRIPDALQSACSGGYKVIAQMLLDRGARLDVKSGYLGCALQAACAEGHVDLARLLLSRGADVDAQDEESTWGNALQAACAGGHETVVQTLLEHGATVAMRGGLYGSAVQAARAGGHVKVTQLLIDAGAQHIEQSVEREQTTERSDACEVRKLVECPGDPCRLKPHCWYDVKTKKRYRVLTAQLKLLVKYKQKGNRLLSHEDVPEQIRQKLRSNVSECL